jgi:hypothetical protein
VMHLKALKAVCWFAWLLLDAEKCLLATTSKKERAEMSVILAD